VVLGFSGLVLLAKAKGPEKPKTTHEYKQLAANFPVGGRVGMAVPGQDRNGPTRPGPVRLFSGEGQRPRKAQNHP